MIQELPSEILEKVFIYLSLKDILNARQTCKKFQVKNRRFLIRGQNDRQGRRTSLYLETFGCRLKHLTIVLVPSFVRRHTSQIAQSRRVYAELQDIFNNMILTKKLHSFTCVEWFALRFDREVPFDRAAVRAAMCRMLVEQESLSAVHFIDCLRDEQDGVDVLRALASQTIASTLTSLTFKNLFQAGINTDFVPDFLELMGKLTKLKYLRITYRYLSEDAMAKLISASPFLKVINLSVDEYVTRISGPPPDWQKIVKKRPGLRVSVEMKVMRPQYRYQDFLLPDMPLTSLRFIIAVNFELSVRRNNRSVQMIEAEITDVTRYISKYPLKVFILEIEFNGLQGIVWDRPNALVDLVNGCPSLAHLSLRVTVSLEILLEMAAAARPVARGEEDGGHPARPPLLIHLAGCDTVLDKGAKDRLSAVNASCTVHICEGCETLLNRQA